MNTPDSPASQPVAARKVADDARMQTLPTHFGKHLLTVESAIYTFMRQLARQYTGGYWHFYELSNGGFYMAPDGGEFDIYVEGNDYEGRMSADAAGMTACLFAFSHLSFQIQDDDRVASHYHWLLDFACQHPEASQILAAID